MAAGIDEDASDDGSSSDSGMGVYPTNGYGHNAGRHGGRGGGGGGGGAWGEYGSEDEGDWGVEYAWSAQGGLGRHQGPTLVGRMPQAICTNYLRVRCISLS